MSADLRDRDVMINLLTGVRKLLLDCRVNIDTYSGELVKDDPLINRIKRLEEIMDKVLEIYDTGTEFYEMAGAYLVQLRYCRHCFLKTVTTDLQLEQFHAPGSDN